MSAGAQPFFPAADTGSMGKPKPDNRTTFSITLSGADLVRWHALAKRQGITLEQLVKESVEMAIARQASR